VTSSAQKRIPLWFLVSLCVGATTWLYIHRILIPWAAAKALQGSELKAQMGDLYSPWVGTHELLLHRRNPYGQEVSHEIQRVLYGHAIQQIYGEPGVGVVNEQRFAYPVYAVFLLAPAVYADFAQVQRWAPFALALLTAIGVLLGLDILHLLSWEVAIASVLFTLSSPQIVQGLRLQQLALVVGFLLMASAWCVHKGHLVAAGVLLALSTIKPQMALLPLVWFILWAAGELSIRWRVLAGFGVTMAALVGGGELLLPGWLSYFFAGMAAYRKYFPTTSHLRLLLGDTLGIVASAFIVIWLLTFGWRNRKVARDSQRFALVVATFLMVTLLAFPLFTPFNQVLLILPSLLVVSEWATLSRLSRLTFITIVSWPWITSAVLLLLRPLLNPASQVALVPAFVASFMPLVLPWLILSRRTMVGVLVDKNAVSG
jgi:hypothetical protein